MNVRAFVWWVFLALVGGGVAHFAGGNPLVGASIGAAIGMGLTLFVSFGKE